MVSICFMLKNKLHSNNSTFYNSNKLQTTLFFLQGVMALYKGVQNDFAISCIRKAVEVLLSENTTLPLYASTFLFLWSILLAFQYFTYELIIDSFTASNPSLFGWFVQAAMAKF